MNPFLVGIAGGSASGKTYILNELLNHFTKEELCLISQDHYYKPQEFQYIDEKGEINYDLPEGIDKDLLISDINTLISGKQIYKEEYTFNNPNATPKMLTVQPAPLIVIEGLFIFHFEEIAKQLHFKVFVDADDDIKLNRRLTRDQQERGYSTETILYQWHNHVMPAYHKYLLPYKQDCDFIIHNNDDINQEIKDLSGFIKNALKQE